VPAESRLLAIVPARGGSKRLPGKNLASLGGRPLIDYTALPALACARFCAVVISTDDEAIADRARALGLLYLGPRPAALARDETPIVDTLRHALGEFETAQGRVDAVVLLQPTSPFRTAAMMAAAAERFERSRADTLTAVHAARDHPYWLWRIEGETLAPHVSMQAIGTERANLPPLVAETGTIYIVRRDLLAAGRLYGERVVAFPVDDVAAVDIDTADDLAWAGFLIERGLAPRLPEGSG